MIEIAAGARVSPLADIEDSVRGTRISIADGVVIGSALVRRVLDGGGPDGAAELVAEFRAAIDR